MACLRVSGVLTALLTGRSVFIILLLVGFAVLLCFLLPFAPEHEWKLPVRAALVVVSCLIEVLDVCVATSAVGRTGDLSQDSTVQGLAVAVFISCISMPVVRRLRR